MKVLFCVRRDITKRIASDTVQLDNIVKNMKNKDIEITINDGTITNYDNYDCVHIFNLSPIGETYKYFKQATLSKKKIIITPLYWNMENYYENFNDIENIRFWNKTKIYRKHILKNADKVIVSSNTEKDMLIKDFGSKINYEIIYNILDYEDLEIPLYNFKERHNLNEYVLSVNPVNRRENQIQLCKVCNKLNINLVLIGAGDKEYIEECTKYDNVLYLGVQKKYDIFNAYRFARVHAVNGFGKIMDISSLEGAAYGCNLVCSTEGSSMEYFKDLAFYASPYDENQLEDTIVKAFKKRKNDQLKKYLRNNFSCENSITSLFNIYNSLKN